MLQENAILLHKKDNLIIGKKSLGTYSNSIESKNINIDISWEPDFVDVASSGDLGYDYGKYTITFTDPSGHKINKKGISHTVWKRQVDGTWQFQWPLPCTSYNCPSGEAMVFLYGDHPYHLDFLNRANRFPNDFRKDP